MIIVSVHIGHERPLRFEFHSDHVILADWKEFFLYRRVPRSFPWRRKQTGRVFTLLSSSSDCSLVLS